MKTIAFAPFAALAVMAAQPAAAEVVEQSKDHFVTRSSATVKATPRQTWLALIEPAKWWNKAHTWSGDSANLSITPQGGGCFCERIPEKDTLREVGLAGSAQHMVVVQAKPMEVLRMRGVLGPLQSEPAEGVLTIAMQPVDGGTKIVWEYIVGGPMRYEIPTIAKAVDGVLAEQLGSFADLLGRLDEPAAKAPAKPAPEAAGTPDDEPANVEDAIDAMGSGKKPKSD